MPNPILTKDQRELLFKPLFEQTKTELERLSDGNSNVLWALRRKLAKELTYLERGNPRTRGGLKKRKREEQDGLCAFCGDKLPMKGAELDRFDAVAGYTVANTRLVHHECHIADQQAKNFK